MKGKEIKLKEGSKGLSSWMVPTVANSLYGRQELVVTRVRMYVLLTSLLH